MKKFFTRDNIRGVLQSLVASILFLILLEPAIEIGKNFGKGIISSFIDYFYHSCARENGIGFISYLALFAILWFAVYMIQMFLSTAFSPDEKKKSTETDENTDANLSSKNPENDLKEIEAKIDKLEKQKTRSKRTLIMISRINIAIWVLFLCYIVIYQYAPVVANKTFSRRIVQITPYIETSEIDLLKSEWVSMESKDDFDRIAEKIDNILSENDLK